MKKKSRKKFNENKIPVNNKNLVTIDKLQFKFYSNDDLLDNFQITKNITIEQVKSLDEFYFEKSDIRFYKNYFKVLFKNKTVAVILNNNKIYNGSNSLLIFLNKTFYSNFNELYDEFKFNKIFDFKYFKLYKIDIALDLNKCFMKRLNIINIRRCQNKIHLKYNIKFKEEEFKQSYYIGRKKIINIYDKLKQLENGKKPYICDYYLKNNFKLEKGVTRLELRIDKRKGGFIEKILSKIDLNKLTDNKYISEIVNEIFDKKLVVVYKGSKSVNRSRLKKEKLLNVDFNYIGSEINYTDNNYTNQPSIKTIKSSVKRDFFNWMRISGGDIESDLYLNILEFVENYRLIEWFNNFKSNNLNLEREYKAYNKKYNI
jgi:hypothetical protein